MQINLEEAKNYSGWLEKKSNKTFAGYQKRFFRIFNGEYIAYYENENDLSNFKGRIPIDSIESIQKKDDKKLLIVIINDERIFHLKAKTKEDRDKWVAVIEILLASKESQQDRSATVNITNTNNKLDQLDNNNPSYSSSISINKKGYNNKSKNKYIKLNIKLLDKKGINNLLSLSNPDIKKRFYSGFLKREKNLKEMELQKKKYWVVLISSRPLRNIDYEKEDKMLDNSKLKEWLKFDTLFFFNPEDDNEIEPNMSLDLKECHSISYEEKNSKFFISIAVGDNNYYFYNKFHEDIDLLFEVLKNSRRTAKEIANSITKRPRNMVRLSNIFDKKGKKEYLDEIEKEENKNLGNYLKIHDFDTFLFIINELEKIINEILDGCLLIHKDNPNIFEASVDHFIDIYLKIVSSFWEENYKRLDNEKIIKMSNILFDFEDLLKKFRVEDQNFEKNANELVKIYIKKIYKQILEFIQNILKSEREIKQVQNSNKHFITNGPNDLFSMLSNIISANKNIKISYIHTYILNMLYEGIIQFLIGTDCITSNYNLKVEPEYLIAIANNTVEFLPLLNDFIDKYKENCILSEKRINDEIHMMSILKSLNLLRKNVAIRFVTQLSQPLAESFDSYYHLLDLTKIIDITSDTYFKYSVFMNDLVKKRIWEEILKLTIYYYMKVLTTTSTKGIKTSDELIKKLTEDKTLIKDQYSIIVGDNLTSVNLKIFDDLIAFLQTDLSLIPSTCIPLRQFCGPTFNIDIVNKLLIFRTDLSKDDLKEVIQECKDTLKNYKEDEHTDSFFEDMEKNAERRLSVRERMAMRIKKPKNQENNIENKNNEEPFDELEINIFKFEDFIDEENDEKDNNENNIDNNNIIKTGNEKVSDVIMEGKMKKKKKGNNKYQERYFQLKNGYLYWFLDETSRKIQKKISLKNIIKVETKGPTKIIIVVEDPNEKEGGGNIYKLITEDENTKLAWVKAITDEMKKIFGENRNKNNALYKTELKKKCISDILQLPDIGTERTNIKLQIIEQIKSEGIFKYIGEENKNKKEDNNNIENYDPHEALFNEGKLKHFDVGLEEARDRQENRMFGNCCDSFFNLFSKKKK